MLSRDWKLVVVSVVVVVLTVLVLQGCGGGGGGYTGGGGNGGGGNGGGGGGGTTIVTFEKTFGGPGLDAGYSVQQTRDGGYIITGLKDTSVYLLKTDTQGVMLWEKTFSVGFADKGWSVQETTDGGYIIAGEAFITGPSHKVYLIKTDSQGNKLWEKVIGGAVDECAYSVQQTRDGGYIITGWTNSFGAGGQDVYLVKTDSQGNKSWERTFGSKDNDCGYSVRETRDGGFIISGTTYSTATGNYDVYLVRTDSAGNKLWDKTFGGVKWDYGQSVQETMDGGFIVVGNSYTGEGQDDFYLLKVDAQGNKVWEKTFGGSDSDLAREVQETQDRGFIIAGWTKSMGAGSEDVYLLKTDSEGNKLWERTFGGSKPDTGYSVKQTRDGGYIIVGYTESFEAGNRDVYLIKTDTQGLVSKRAYFKP